MMGNLEKNRTDPGAAGNEQVEKLLRLREHLQVRHNAKTQQKAK